MEELGKNWQREASLSLGALGYNFATRHFVLMRAAFERDRPLDDKLVLAGFKTESDDKLALKPPCHSAAPIFSHPSNQFHLQSLLRQPECAIGEHREDKHQLLFPQIKNTQKSPAMSAMQ